MEGSVSSEYLQQVVEFNLIDFTQITPTFFVAFGILILLLLCSSLVSGAEVAFFSLRKKHYKLLAEDTDASAKRTLDLIYQPKYLLATILITNNLINISFIIISSSMVLTVLQYPNWWIELLIDTGLITFLIVLFGEVIPKIYANNNGLKLAQFMSAPLSVLKVILTPFNAVLVKAIGSLEGRMIYNPSITSTEIDQAIDLTVNGNASSKERKILKGIIKFGDIQVKAIMKSRVDVIAIDEEDSFNRVLKTVRSSGYSRIPVYSENMDGISGIIYGKDLIGYLNEKENFDWKALLRPAFFVPESKKIDDLLKEFQTRKMHMAIVVDEYGGTSGIVTLEDIVEEILGEIKDEYDKNPDIDYKKINDNTFIFEGKTSINDLCKVLEINIDTFDEVRNEADSLAGIILELNGKIPKINDSINFKQFQFKINSCSNIRIEQVQLIINK